MPKLQHTFVQGKMNKDLDERLVPNGQYRDAQNIQISTSEGSDVGAVENILGNYRKTLRSINPEVHWPAGFGLLNPVCIGAVRDTQNEKIYWFIKSDLYDAIAEFDQTTGIIAPVCVDRNGVLNFDTHYLITGVNVLEGMLIWTDGLNEPKNLDIEVFKAGSTDFLTQTSVYGRQFIESDITVIKPRPGIAPTITKSPSKKTGSLLGCGITPAEVIKDFSINIPNSGGLYRLPETGEFVVLTFKGLPDWAINDIVVFTASDTNDENYEDEYVARLSVQNFAQNGILWDITFEVLSISQNIVNKDYLWSGLLEEDEPLFKLKFPRFAYRWKFADNTYSTYSPFTEVAFIGNKFEYKSYKATNSGMNNYIRTLSLSGFATPPADVVEIDILYKESNSTAVYKIDSILPTDTSFEVKSNVIGNVISPSQLLRAWDNVPITAKAQEIIANRIVYGNYEQGYDMGVTPVLTASVASSVHTDITMPIESVKSMRNYNIGVVYGDKFGRETPVFTSSDAAVRVQKYNSLNTNKLKVDITSAAPNFADYFKLYVKETSNEYYNMALDRFYKADDGNVWLSFPSAERNKIAEDQYIILKKEHGTDNAVTADVRYRVLDISNEAPEDIIYSKIQSASATVYSGVASVFSDTITFSVAESSPEFIASFNGNAWIKLEYGREYSDFYKIKDGGLIGTNTTDYSITLERKLQEEATDIVTHADFNIVVYKEEAEFRQEYKGKFFAKINRDSYFDKYILSAFIDLDPIYVYRYLGAPYSTAPAQPWLQEDIPVWLGGEPTFASNTMSITFINRSPYNNPGETGRPEYDDGLDIGNYIKFVEDTAQEIHFKIIDVDYTYTTYGGVDAMVKTVTFDRTFGLDTTGWGSFNFQMFTASAEWKDYLDGNEIFVSTNPAIFETEPKETAELDIYYEATNAIAIANHSNTITLDWFNCYSFGNGVESNRIRDDFNAPLIDKGPKVSATLEEPYAREKRGAGLIFSELFNSRSSFNGLNQFNMAESITKDINPIYGSIQKLHSRGAASLGDLLVLAEDKCFKVLANKDALYNADGSANLTASNRVLGQVVPFAGDFGISKNPESFASFGFRSYFTDKARGAVLRLSADGLTEINSKGMNRYFQNALKSQTTPIIGAYDEDIACYNLAIGSDSVSFKEEVDGWTTRMSYQPEWGVSLNNTYYTFNNGDIWEHTNPTRSNFYGTQFDTTITPIFNDAPTSIKNFKTLSYEGQEGWVADVITDQQDGEVKTWKKKEGIFFNYINGLATTWDNATQSGALDTAEFSVQGLGVLTDAVTILPGNVFEILLPGNANVSLQTNDPIYYKSATSGLVYIVGKVSAINNNNLIIVPNTYSVPTPQIGDFVFFAKDSEKNTSGIVGYYAQVLMTLSSSTKKELFAVNSEVFISSE